MKKIAFIIITILTIYSYTIKKDSIIPQDSIRFRIIANSNTDIDQKTKLQIKEELAKNLFPLLEKSTSKEETKRIIENNQAIIKQSVEKYDLNYSIKYGNNYFPEKEYKGITYEKGEYESLVISLGKAEGENWWCVMYPPLCLIDSKSNNMEDAEYRFYIQDIISKLIKNM